MTARDIFVGWYKLSQNDPPTFNRLPIVATMGVKQREEYLVGFMYIINKVVEE